MYPNHLGGMVNPMRLYYSIFEEGRNMVKFAVTFINSEITNCWKFINGRLMCIFFTCRFVYLAASVGCSLGNGTDGYLTFYLELNGDTVSRVYTVNQTDLTVTTAETYSSSTTNITGDGSAGNPFTFTLSVTNINTPDITILDSGVIAYTKVSFFI